MIWAFPTLALAQEIGPDELLLRADADARLGDNQAAIHQLLAEPPRDGWSWVGAEMHKLAPDARLAGRVALAGGDAWGAWEAFRESEPGCETTAVALVALARREEAPANCPVAACTDVPSCAANVALAGHPTLATSMIQAWIGDSIRLGPDVASAWKVQAAIRTAASDHVGAAGALANALAATPADERARQELALAWADAGDLASARDVVRFSRRPSTAVFDALDELQASWVSTAPPRAAIEVAQRVAADRPAVIRADALRHLMDGDADLALAAIGPMAARHPGDPELVAIVRQAARQTEPSLGVDAVVAALATTQDPARWRAFADLLPDALLTAAKHYAAKGGISDSAAAFERAAWLLPDNPGLWRAVGGKRWQLGHLDAAQVAWLRAWALDPTDPTVRSAVIGLYAERGDAVGAQSWLGAQVDLSPAQREAIEREIAVGQAIQRATSRRVAGDLDGALATLAGAPADPPSAKLKQALGDTYGEMGRHAESREAYAQGVAIDPADAWLALGLARATAAEGDSVGAVAMLDALDARALGDDVQRESDRVRSRIALDAARQAARDRRATDEDWKLATEAATSSADLRALGWAAYDVAAIGRATRIFRAAVVANPADTDARRGLALALNASGRTEQALDVLDPSDPITAELRAALAPQEPDQDASATRFVDTAYASRPGRSGLGELRVGHVHVGQTGHAFGRWAYGLDVDLLSVSDGFAGRYGASPSTALALEGKVHALVRIGASPIGFAGTPTPVGLATLGGKLPFGGDLTAEVGRAPATDTELSWTGSDTGEIVGGVGDGWAGLLASHAAGRWSGGGSARLGLLHGPAIEPVLWNQGGLWGQWKTPLSGFELVGNLWAMSHTRQIDGWGDGEAGVYTPFRFASVRAGPRASVGQDRWAACADLQAGVQVSTGDELALLPTGWTFSREGGLSAGWSPASNVALTAALRLDAAGTWHQERVFFSLAHNPGARRRLPTPLGSPVHGIDLTQPQPCFASP